MRPFNPEYSVLMIHQSARHWVLGVLEAKNLPPTHFGPPVFPVLASVDIVALRLHWSEGLPKGTAS